MIEWIMGILGILLKKCSAKYGGDMDCIVKGSQFILSVMIKG